MSLKKVSSAVRWWLGMRVAAPELEAGSDEGFRDFYQRRVTDCHFLSDPDHFEYPRARWILDRVRGGRLLEVGCGNGGMTRELVTKVDHLVALDVSTPSLAVLRDLSFCNAEIVEDLIEHYNTEERFDWIVMSEVLEHLRQPTEVVSKCLRLLKTDGRLLVTTPNGHWESDEHLQEFDLAEFARLLARSGAEGFHVGYLRDREERPRWLVAEASAPSSNAAQNEFSSRWAIAKERARRKNR